MPTIVHMFSHCIDLKVGTVCSCAVFFHGNYFFVLLGKVPVERPTKMGHVGWTCSQAK